MADTCFLLDGPAGQTLNTGQDGLSLAFACLHPEGDAAGGGEQLLQVLRGVEGHQLALGNDQHLLTDCLHLG